MSRQPHSAADRDHLWHPFTPHDVWEATPPLIIDHAEGCWLFDVNGNRYLDGVSSLWTNVHGHRHPCIDAAVREQLEKMAHSTLLGLTHPPAIELAAELVDRAPHGLKRVFYSDNGSTAVEVAIKMAFQFHINVGAPERQRFATLTDAYHGDTLGAVSVGQIERFHRLFHPLLFETVALPAPRTPGGIEETECLERALAILEAEQAGLAALVFEPLVQGAAGMKMHSPGYLRPLLEAARRRGLLLIADEVAVGFGRTGTLFAMEQIGVTPDFLCLAKGLSAGYVPLAATLTTEDMFRSFLGVPGEDRQFFHGHTFTGNPLGCAAAIASLDVFETENVLDHVAEVARRLEDRLRPMRGLAGVDAIRQKGVMVGIDLSPRSPGRLAKRLGHEVAMAARPRGAILRPLGDTLVLNPPLAISLEEVDLLARIAGEAITEVMGRPD